MRVLITGGTGFLGRALTASLSKDGHQVIILSRQPDRVPGFDASVQVMPWDASSTEGWGHLVNDADIILNLAGESIAGTGITPSRWSQERKDRILESRVQAGRAVVQTVEAATQKPRLLIQASAVGYYGPGDDTEITEDSPAGNDFLANVCTQWEASTQRVEKLGVQRVILRTGLVLSPHDSVLPRLMLPFKFFAGGSWAAGSNGIPGFILTTKSERSVF